jgi:hypothetical protein
MELLEEPHVCAMTSLAQDQPVDAGGYTQMSFPGSKTTSSSSSMNSSIPLRGQKSQRPTFLCQSNSLCTVSLDAGVFPGRANFMIFLKINVTFNAIEFFTSFVPLFLNTYYISHGKTLSIINLENKGKQEKEIRKPQQVPHS